ncbi:uncharacterized protein LOC6558644 [Drosophila grimshawi]|uniref:GH14997 n=1 Tax=Drosophila grimshawi TaxID=7222 RepID=B4J0J3_DROGR|nr:uncharacterized protein LOC6558644 [Drosophila grimshawi]EDV96829.1 GH14997 [Drosophila grimshawi]
MLFLAPRKHLLASNLIILLMIYIMRKCLQLFCIIENKACKKPDCKCESDQSVECLDSPPVGRRGGFKLIPDAMRKTMHGFGYGEGHYQIFVEKKERNLPTKSRLNAASAELKLNPN